MGVSVQDETRTFPQTAIEKVPDGASFLIQENVQNRILGPFTCEGVLTLDGKLVSE